MTEIRTFKDLELYYQDRMLLKQVVINWIKCEYIMGYSPNQIENKAIKDWIKHFFNITEEDLK
jgi:hypothetical protein